MRCRSLGCTLVGEWVVLEALIMVNLVIGASMNSMKLASCALYTVRIKVLKE